MLKSIETTGKTEDEAIASADEVNLGDRSVVAVFHAGRLGAKIRRRLFKQSFVTADRYDGRKHLFRYGAGAQYDGGAVFYFDDRRFKTYIAFAAVYHGVYPSVKVGFHVLRRRRRRRAGDVRGRRGYRDAARLYKLARDGVRRYAHRHGVEPARHLARYYIFFR